MRLMLVEERKAETLQRNTTENVHGDLAPPSDGWKSYQSLLPRFVHDSVNHRLAVRKDKRKESAHQQPGRLPWSGKEEG
jgi:hypothetical protein